jgi:hypothetical protein
MLTLELLY